MTLATETLANLSLPQKVPIVISFLSLCRNPIFSTTSQSGSSPSLRKSTLSNKGQQHTPKFHATNLYNFGFLVELGESITVIEALSSDHSEDWKEAMDKEYNSLINNLT